MIVSQLKGYLSWVQTARGRSGSILSSRGIKGKSEGLVREDGIITLLQVKEIICKIIPADRPKMNMNRGRNNHEITTKTNVNQLPLGPSSIPHLIRM